MTRPGTGTSLTTGEAAARRQALGEAARVARAAVMGDETDAVCLNIADDIRALMDRAPDVGAERAAEFSEDELLLVASAMRKLGWVVERRDVMAATDRILQSGMDTARARIAELEREVGQVIEANESLYRMGKAARRSGAEAMREAAARYVEGGVTRREDWYQLNVASAIRALPLPQEETGE